MDPALHHSVRRPQSRENKARTQGLLGAQRPKLGPRVLPGSPALQTWRLTDTGHGARVRLRCQPCCCTYCQLDLGRGSLSFLVYNVLTSGPGFSKAMGWGMFTKVQRQWLCCSDTVYWGGWLGRSPREVSSCGVWSPTRSDALGVGGDAGNLCSTWKQQPEN